MAALKGENIDKFEKIIRKLDLCKAFIPARKESLGSKTGLIITVGIFFEILASLTKYELKE